MSLSARISGSWKAGDLYARIGGVWKLLTSSVRPSGAWKDVGGGAAALSAAASPTSLVQQYTGEGGITNGTTVTPAGGASPYAYAWSQVSGSGFLSVDQPTSASTVFAGDGLAYPTTYSAIFQCTVTDSVGATATALVAVEFDPG